MNNTKRDEILCEVLVDVYNVFQETNNFINQSLVDVFNGEEVPVDEVFFICFWLQAMVLFVYKVLKVLISTVKVSCFKVFSIICSLTCFVMIKVQDKQDWNIFSFNYLLDVHDK